MAQFQAYRLPGNSLVLDLQSDLVATPSRLVGPLIPESFGLKAISRLEPVFEVEGQRLALHMSELASVPARLVEGDPVADLRGEHVAIMRALDVLVSGF